MQKEVSVYGHLVGLGDLSADATMETEQEMTTQPYQIQKAYKEAIGTFINTVRKECLKSNIEYNLIETSAPFDKALFSYIQKRSRLH